jgi:hypothetical protein
VRGIAIGARGADPYGLREVVDPHENQIEPPRADAALQIVQIAKRFGKAQFAARQFRRDDRDQHLGG